MASWRRFNSGMLAVGLATLGLVPLDASTKRVAQVPREQVESFERGDKVAVVVGVGAYPDLGGLSSLSYAAKDADALASKLESKGYVVKLLKDEDATWGTVRMALNLAVDLVAEDGTLLFYFSGHGFSDEKNRGYLATMETSLLDLERTGTSLDGVMEVVEKAPARRKILLIDACRDNPLESAKSAGARALVHLRESEGVRVLFSTKSGSYSHEDRDIGHGVFTYYLLKGLDGAAAGPDGLITFRDLADYTTRKVKLHAFEKNWSQVPYEGSAEASGDFLIARATEVEVRQFASSPASDAGARAAPPSRSRSGRSRPASSSNALGSPVEARSHPANSATCLSESEQEPLIAGVGGVSPPSIIAHTRVAPVYPELALRGRLAGRVTLQAVINKWGIPEDLKVLRCDYPNVGFEQAAIEAVQEWVYVPAMKGRCPVPVHEIINLDFELN